MFLSLTYYFAFSPEEKIWTKIYCFLCMAQFMEWSAQAHAMMGFPALFPHLMEYSRQLLLLYFFYVDFSWKEHLIECILFSFPFVW